MATVVAAWPTVALGEVVRQRKEFIQIDDTAEYKRCRVQLHARGIVLRDIVAGAEIKTKSQQVCHAGEFLVAEIDAKVGGFGIVPEALEGAIVSSHYFLFMVDDSRLDKRFLDYFIRTHDFQEQVTAQGTTNYAAIRPADVLGYIIPLPPLDEQRRIVARIEELAARIEQARGLRREAMAEAEALWGAYAYESLENLNEVTPRAIADIAEVRGGIQKSPARTAASNPVRYLTVAHVQRNHVAVDDPRYFEVAPDELERWRLRTGDVLIVEGNGSADQIGRTALFRGEIDPCVHQNHVIRIRPVQSLIDPEYLNLYLNSPVGQSEVQSRSRTTSGLNILSVGRINSIKVLIPSLAAQHRIVARLRDVQAKSTLLKQVQQGVAEELDSLLPSVLDKAFRGEL